MAGGDLTATITILDVDHVDSISGRSVVLSKPNWSVKIGRGTLSGDEGLRPAEDNAWFDSRVMSRNHAILRADPNTRVFTIEDTGSMHGTQCNGRRLKTKAPQLIVSHDTLIFGADVTRGSSQFRALKVMVGTSWSDEKHSDSIFPSLPSFRNTFSADYSEEDIYDDAADQDDIYDQEPTTTVSDDEGMKADHLKEPSLARSHGDHANWADHSEDEHSGDQDDEVEIVKESIRAPSVEVIVPPRAESVVASEDSGHASSYFSEGEVGESPTSSPLGLNDDRAENATHDTSPKAFRPRADLRDEEFTADIAESYVELDHEAQYAIQGEAEDMREQLDCQFLPSADLRHAYDAASASTHKPLSLPHPSDAVRAPSPSEVAMVKPTSDVIIQQPFLQPVPAYRELPAYPIDMSSRDTAWDGANWDLYDPPHPRFIVSENPSVRDTNYVPFDTQYMTNPPPLDLRYASATTIPAQLSDVQPPPVAISEAKPIPKCSIAQLLDQSKNNDEQMRKFMGNSLKRKVDQMSDSPEEMQSAERQSLTVAHNDPELSPVVEKSNTVYGATEPESKIAASSRRETSAQSGPEEVSEEIEVRPRKKVKHDQNQGNHGGTFMKLAAATIAGVAIGTVGTIIGLASLPQDYFL